MYLSGGGNASANVSLARNYAIWSALLRSPGYKGQNPAGRAEIKSYYITREMLTRMVTVDEIINVNASKGLWKAQN